MQVEEINFKRRLGIVRAALKVASQRLTQAHQVVEKTYLKGV